MPKTNVTGKRLFVLDTNVLIHDPSSLFRFKEHNLFLPMMVLEELDNNKIGHGEVARNARQASRFLDELIKGIATQDIAKGITLDLHHINTEEACGRLFFQTEALTHDLPEYLPGNHPDNNILGTALALQQIYPETLVTMVSKDINLRIKAAALGIHAEDYHNDQVIEDADILFKGYQELESGFWDRHGKQVDSWIEQGRTFYRVTGPDVANWYSNEFLHSSDDAGFEAVVRSTKDDEAVIETVRDYSSANNKVWGISARNREQNYALNLLMDPEVDFVSLLGMAGTGKTLLTLAAGLEQTLEKDRYREIIMTRVTVPVGEDIGYLPGTEEEKMTPWMGALMDNLEVLSPSNQQGGDWARAATNDLLSKRIKIRSINFMRGRTFLNRYIIIDEAQNMTPKQLKTLITRAGPGTKVVCLGNIAQIDTPYLTESTSGLTYVVERFKHWPHSGHVTMTRGERSRLADYASEIL
ncbi:MAG: PhoH family protein [Gammaproteobacteria bacterium]|nr:PhoH family protein [Gammaproteobacteria bacterium]MDH5651089.1 PhoH family protein [Gammaproteobacteria bacterium]